MESSLHLTIGFMHHSKWVAHSMNLPNKREGTESKRIISIETMVSPPHVEALVLYSFAMTADRLKQSVLFPWNVRQLRVD